MLPSWRGRSNIFYQNNSYKTKNHFRHTINLSLEVLVASYKHNQWQILTLFQGCIVTRANDRRRVLLFDLFWRQGWWYSNKSVKRGVFFTNFFKKANPQTSSEKQSPNSLSSKMVSEVILIITTAVTERDMYWNELIPWGHRCICYGE